jgi:exodeoxyribonuclease VII large subunit
MLDDLLKPDSDQILQVTELTRHIKRQLESRFTQVWVRGEVSNLRKQSSGHLYFSLKDSGSQIPCALFARDAARQSVRLKDGMELLLFGDVSIYEPHGRYQLIAKIAIQSGEGRLQVEFERLKRKLAEEGLFDKAPKKNLPLLPARVALITSPSGAAVRDFIRILRRREYGGEIVLFPARVQGSGAAKEVAAMLEYACASPGFDLVVLTRGGGSIEDLWAFNEESLARAVAAASLPVISAIGHEIDMVLTDYAADVRAETPSAAAELISSLYLDTRQRLEEAGRILKERTELGLASRRQSLEEIRGRMRIIAPDRQAADLGMKLDDLENRLERSLRSRLNREQSVLNLLSHRLFEHHPKNRIALHRLSLTDSARRLRGSIKVGVRNQRDRLSQLEKRLGNSSLHATLRRGYAIMQNPEGSIVENAEKAQSESELRARFHDGAIKLKVIK